MPSGSNATFQRGWRGCREADVAGRRAASICHMIRTELCCAATARALNKPSRHDTWSCGWPITSSVAVASSAATVTFTGKCPASIVLDGRTLIDGAAVAKLPTTLRSRGS